MLSWAAKFGIPKESRRALGYHAAPGDKVMEAYGRDDMAAPLREMTEMLQRIAGDNSSQMCRAA